MQAFDGQHKIKSGVIELALQITPSGSTSITKPIEVSFGGPFMDTGVGKLPESDFTIAISAQGHRGALQVISAAGKGFITVSGQSYRMPAATFKNLESGFGSIASSGGASSGNSGNAKSAKGAFAALGIKPLDWLVRPQIVGTTMLGGVKTTRVRAGLNATAMLHDLSKLIGETSKFGVSSTSSSVPHSISSATQRRIAHALGSPSFNVWTGSADKLIRKLTLTASIPVTGQTRTELGGMRSATVTLDFEYRDLNRPQTITAPSATKPYSVFRAEVTNLLDQVGNSLNPGTSTGTSTTGTGAASAADQRYTRCINDAKGDVSKMQKCGSLLGG